MSELPAGWESCSLEELLTSLESGSRPRGGVRGIQEGVPSVGGEHLTYSGTFDFSNVKYVPSAFAKNMTQGHIRVNDILIVKDGATTGKTAFVSKDFPYSDAVVNEHVFVCRLTELIESQFLFRYLISQDGQTRVLENFKGSAQGGINRSFVANTEIALAPRNEQRRIVAKLEKLLSRVDVAQAQLANIPRILKRFRHSVLDAACSGRLTTEWRFNNPTANGQEPFGSKCATMLEELPYEIPETWVTKPLESLCTKITDGEHLTPPLSSRGVPLLSAKDVRDNFLDFTETKFVPPEVAAKSRSRCKPERGDVLVVSRGATVGRTCRVQTDVEFCLMGSVLLFKPNTNLIHPNLLEYCFKSPHGLTSLIGRSGATAQQAIYIRDMKTFPVPLPPLDEQQEIVRRVEALFKTCDELAARYRKAKTYVDKLTQSILAKAFRGELVPQDPNDEPASVLLERIRQEQNCKSAKTRRISRTAHK